MLYAPRCGTHLHIGRRQRANGGVGNTDEREEPICECHGHIFMDGKEYAHAAARHRNGIDRGAVRRNLEALKSCGVRYFRDGGDAFGVSLYARELAGEYGIDYVTPVFAIHRRGLYGGIVGLAYDSIDEYRALVQRAKAEGADFIKLMFSGLVCFDVCGRLSSPPLPPDEISALVAYAHAEGLRVMAHVNGAPAVRAALEAGTDSIEHGYFMDGECLALLRQSGAVWVPTLAAITAFLGREGFDRQVTERILAGQRENLRAALTADVRIATGSDAGAVGVTHGGGILAERRVLAEAAGKSLAPALQDSVRSANAAVRSLFRRP